MKGITNNSDMDKRNQMTVESAAADIAAKMNFIKTYSHDAEFVQKGINYIVNRLESMKEVLENESNEEMFEKHGF